MAASPIICFLRAADSSNTPLSGAKANIYAAGTTTPLSLYSDTGLSVAADNPIVADANGQFAIRYFSPVQYKISTTTSAGVAVTGLSWDNIDPGVPIVTGALPVASGGTGATTAGGARTNLGAAADSTVTSIASDVTTLQGYHTGTTALKVAAGTTAQRSGSPSAYDTRGNTTLTTPEIYLGGTWHKLSMSPSVLSFQNLVITTAAASTSITLTADSVALRDTNKVAITRDSVSLTIDCTTTGANGLDAGSLANTTWYYSYVIFNPSTGTTAGLASSSATSPTLPSGYTFYARFGAHRTDGSAQFLAGKQYGRRFQYTTIREMSSGGAVGSVTTPTYTAVAVGSYVPTSVAFRIFGSLWGNNGIFIAAPNSSYGAHTGSSTAPPVGINIGTASTAQQFDFILESTNIHWATSGTGASIRCMGWEDNI